MLREVIDFVVVCLLLIGAKLYDALNNVVSHGVFKICLYDLANGCDFENLCTRAASGVDGAAILLNKFTCTLWRCTLRNMPKFVFDTSFLTFGLQICALC